MSDPALRQLCSLLLRELSLIGISISALDLGLRLFLGGQICNTEILDLNIGLRGYNTKRTGFLGLVMGDCFQNLHTIHITGNLFANHNQFQTDLFLSCVKEFREIGCGEGFLGEICIIGGSPTTCDLATVIAGNSSTIIRGQSAVIIPCQVENINCILIRIHTITKPQPSGIGHTIQHSDIRFDHVIDICILLIKSCANSGCVLCIKIQCTILLVQCTVFEIRMSDPTCRQFIHRLCTLRKITHIGIRRFLRLFLGGQIGNTEILNLKIGIGGNNTKRTGLLGLVMGNAFQDLNTIDIAYNGIAHNSQLQIHLGLTGIENLREISSRECLLGEIGIICC